MAQELWLSEQQLPQLQKLDAQYVARSGMEDAISSGILKGRPFGGVSITWSHDLNHVVTPLTNYQHKRVVAVEMVTADCNYLFISVYMPFYDSRNRDATIVETIDTIAMLDLIIHDHPRHRIVIGGDLNTELRDQSPFDPPWRDFVSKNKLAYCSQFLPPNAYTYHHVSLGHKKLNDHFLISQSIASENISHDHKIFVDGDNPSDHLPITMKMRLRFKNHDTKEKGPQKPPQLVWKKVSDFHKAVYSDILESRLNNETRADFLSCSSTCCCTNSQCHTTIQEEYDKIVGHVISASSALPRHKQGVEKDWWTPDLTRLKNQSIDIERIWAAEGRPGHGPTHLERMRVRADYRRAIAAARKAPKQAAWNRLHTEMATNETNSFWNSWRTLYNKNKSPFAPMVDGQTTKEGIANAFKQSFQANAEPNNKSKVDDLNERFKTRYQEYKESHSLSCNCTNYNITMENVMDAIWTLKSGKCADEDGLTAEHFHNAPFSVLQRLMQIFNQMLRHSFVPKNFRFGFMIPIIKDNNVSHSDVSNYRGITISPIISKIFEHVLKNVYSEFFFTSSHQFGFKKKNSTSHSLYCLRETIDYYVNNGSSVYCSFLDASKAFDRLVHAGLFLKLMERKIPLQLLNILITWHDGLFCRVKWDDYLSDWFPILAGVRQGGVLSPDLYSIYVDDLIRILQSSGVGCYYMSVFAAAFFYADDMVILAPSLKGLEKLLVICNDYCAAWDIRLNSKKTKNMYFGKGSAPSYLLKLDNDEIPWVNRWKYLGVMLKSGPSFACCVKDTLCKFYRALNAILRIEGRSDNKVMLRLLEAHCIPILSFGIEILHVRERDIRRKMRVAYNSVYRKIYSYTQRESVSELQRTLNRPTWEEFCQKRVQSFMHSCSLFPTNSIVRVIHSLNS